MKILRTATQEKEVGLVQNDVSVRALRSFEHVRVLAVERILAVVKFRWFSCF